MNRGSTLHKVNIPKPYISSIFSFSLWHPTLSACFLFFSPHPLLLLHLLFAHFSVHFSPADPIRPSRKKYLFLTFSMLSLPFLVFYRLYTFYHHFHIFLQLCIFLLLQKHAGYRHPFLQSKVTFLQLWHMLLSAYLRKWLKAWDQGMKREKGVTRGDAP